VFGLIGNLGPWELVIILVVVLMIFGPGKLPQVGQSLGKALKSFKKAQEEDEDSVDNQRDKS